MLANGSFDFAGTFGASGTYTFGVKIWVDWNQNGSFLDAGEQMFATTAYTTSISGTIAVPAAALSGVTAMRVGANYFSPTGPADPCANFTSGEYEDYALEVIPLVSCSGTPTSGAATGPASVCPSTNFNLNASGYTTGTGLTYQWESSPGGSGSFNPIAGATNPSYTVAGGISAATDYQLVTTCTNGGASAVSNTVAVGLNSFFNCYCTPASNCTNEGITNVAFNALNNASAFCASAAGYTDYSGLGSLAAVAQGDIVSMSVTAHINSNPASAGVWIDFNHSGTFDASEYTSLGSSTGISPLPSAYVYTGNVTIDAAALTGVTRMRVRQANQGGITSTSSCVNTGVYGEFEDYLITINTGTGCTGTPVAGAASSPATVCPSVNFTVSASGFTSGVTGLTYQWESSPAGSGSWNPIAGATAPSYTVIGGITAATDYRFVITCTNGGGTDQSTVATVNLSSFLSCYCTPTYTNGGASDYIANVQLGTLSNNTGGLGNPSPYYRDYTVQQPTTIAIPDLAQG